MLRLRFSRLSTAFHFPARQTEVRIRRLFSVKKLSSCRLNLKTEQTSINRRLQIKESLEGMTYAQRHKEFQWLAVQLAKTKWPELEATQEQADGGEDATSFFVGSDGLRRRLACSLTGTLEKVKKDVARLRERNVQLDFLVFVTPVPVTNLEVSDWCEAVKKEFGHGLHVIPQAELITMLEQPQNAWLCRQYLLLDFGDEPKLAEFEVSMRRAATELLQGWKTEYRYDKSKAVELTLVQNFHESGKPGVSKIQSKQLSLAELAGLIGRGNRAILLGQPGAGKTFTLIQLADSFLQDDAAPIPFLVSLPGWASDGGDFLPYLEKRLVAFGINADVIAKLSAAGRIVFLINGWNEIPDGFAGRANLQLRDFILNSPATGLIVSTRESRVPVPLSYASTIHVRPLSLHQKLDIIGKSGLGNPPALVRELESNAALAEVTDTPLFLAAIIDLARSGEPLPATRSGILKKFIEQTECNPEHAAALSDPPCAGFHRQYLSRIAGVMTHAGTVTLPLNELLAAVAKCSTALKNDGHLPSVPQSSAVVDALVKHHLLVLSPSLGDDYRFIHQQFQEWFAAEWLYERATELVRNETPDTVFAFQSGILNHIRWQEPLVFLLERLATGTDEQHRMAAKLIRWAMSLDLILAAQLAGISGTHVWPHVRDELSAALRHWYNNKKGEHHRYSALAAMFASGAPDFQDIIWPLLESDNQNSRLETYRIWRPFPLTSLGPDWKKRFEKWNAQRRAEFVHEISWQSNQEIVGLARELIKTDDSPYVKLACLDLLRDAGAYETFVEIVDDPAFREWTKGFLPQVLTRLPKRCRSHFIPQLKAALADTQELNARRVILGILRTADDPDWISLTKAEMNRVLATPGISFRPSNNVMLPSTQKAELPNAAPCIAEYLEATYQVTPDWATEWLANQLGQGQFWWEPFTNYLTKMPDALLEKVAATALDTKLDANELRKRAVLLAGSDAPVVAKTLLKEYLAFSPVENRQPGAPTYHRGNALEAGLHELPVTHLVDAVLAQAQDMTDFKSLQKLFRIVAHSAVSQISKEQKHSLRSFVFRLEELQPGTINDKAGFQAELAMFLGAVGQSEDAKILEAWIEKERQRLADEEVEKQTKLTEWNNAGRKTRCPVSLCKIIHWNSYQRALVRLDCPEAVEVFLRLLHTPDLMGEAAEGLLFLTHDYSQEANSVFGQRPKYSEIYERRQAGQAGNGKRNETVKRYADAIFNSIQTFLPETELADSKFPRREIMRAIAALAGLNDVRAIPLLLKFSSDKNYGWIIANAFHHLTVKGILLPGKPVAEALETFIADHEKQSWGSNTDNWYIVAHCLAVLLFSDTPSVGVAQIRRLPPNRVKSHNIREILELLGACSAPEAAALLIEFSAVPEITQRYFYELVSALSENVNQQARLALLSLLNRLCLGELSAGHDMVDPLAKAIARVARLDETIWTDIKTRCKKSGSAVERNILSIILHAVGTDDAALALCDLIHDEFPIQYWMEQLVENAATTRVPSGGSAYYLKPNDATSLRKRLVGIVQNDVTRRTNALELLAVIAQSRLEHGYPVNEPFHPDIEILKRSSTPWQLYG